MRQSSVHVPSLATCTAQASVALLCVYYSPGVIFILSLFSFSFPFLVGSSMFLEELGHIVDTHVHLTNHAQPVVLCCTFVVDVCAFLFHL